jgi:hypothetical protein
MDWGFLVGIGTIILATATIWSVYVNQKQNAVLFKQINLQLGQQIPYIFIDNVEFSKHTIKLFIRNVTSVSAFWLGLDTHFLIIGQKLYASKDSKNEIGWGEAIKIRDEGKTYYSKYYWYGPNSPKLMFENHQVEPSSVVSFFSPQGVSVILPPTDATICIETTPKFVVSWKNEQGLISYKGFEYDDFRDFLLNNNIRAVAVVMDLVCKDAAEIVHNQGSVASFVVRTDLDKSLSDSSKNSQRFDFIPLSHKESLSEKSWTPYEHYKNTYSNWHIF